MSDLQSDVASDNNDVVPLLRLTAEQRKFASWSSSFGVQDENDSSGFTGLSGHDASASAVGEQDGDIFEQAYRKGWEDCQKALSEEQAEDQRASVDLADAIMHLNDLHSSSSFELVLTAVEALFRRCSELAIPDAELLQVWCSELAELVDQDQKEATLNLHPADLDLINADECKLVLRADKNMMRGNLRLSHSGGWVEKGSEVVLDELRTLIDEFYEKKIGSPK